MGYREQLFHLRDPYACAEQDALFVRAMQENCAFQYAHCAEYRAILDHYKFAPGQLTDRAALARLPALPTVFFKRHEVFSMPKSRMPAQATSSGTKGRMSRIGFDAGGLWCGLDMVLRVAHRRGLLSARPAHYIILGYKPHRGNQTAVTKTAYGSTFFAPALSRTFALKPSAEGYAPDLPGVIDAVCRRAKSAFPTRFMGFPSYAWFMLQQMDEQGLHVQLPAGSKLMLGGGWKQFYAQQVDKTELYALAEKVLGIRDNDIVEFFGAVEHPILYCDCEKHRFHVPVYSRVLIRDVHTLQPVPNGQPGLVNLLTPMIKATPVLSVITDDLGVLYDGGQCGCGCSAPVLEILGRVGLKEIKTCAAGAAELLNGGSV